ncbi:MAG: hypothetical protein KAG99_08815, partial [Bacteroidales bacterium]|nr:hypothetical protein [Bacteroidales bacterium]
MKKFLLLFGMVLVVCSIFAQAPQAFKYQAIARDEAGNILSIRDISIRISIIEEGGDAQADYMETHKMQTNIYGLINLIIGEGDVDKGDFSSIKWGENNHYLKIEMDTDGGEKYKDVGTTQLYSVPYALYAEQAGKIAGNESSTPTSQPQTVRSTSSANNSWGGRNGTPNSRLPADGDSYLNVITGSVGIGTTLPGGDLEVYKPSGQLNVVLNRATNSSAALLDFQTAGSSEWNISTPPGGDDFYIDRSSGSGDLILAYSGGNVGIKNGAPGYPLDVTGIVNAGNYYKNGSEFNEGKWSVNGSEIYYNTSFVGIGTSNPSDKLHVQGGYASIFTTGGSNPTRARFVSSGSDVVLYLFDQNDDIKIKIHSDGPTYFNGGNVGIGCTNPDEELVVGTPLGYGWAVPAITVGGSIGGGIVVGTS